MSRSKNWIIFVLGTTLLCLTVTALMIFVIDPTFHYRKNGNRIKYLIDIDSYQNDGILKHFEYDALITGTSMAENFKKSDVDTIFNVDSVKTCYSGGFYKEINDMIEVAVKSNSSLETIIRSLDLSRLDSDANAMRASDYPEYLYDDDVWNDVSYLLNFDIASQLALPAVLYTVTGRETTSFDEYAYWSDEYTYGRESVLSAYERPEVSEKRLTLSDSDREKISKNIYENVARTIEENPDIQFYYYITPYSIVWWDGVTRAGELKRQIEMQRLLIESLVGYDNCHLVSWCADKELVCNLDNYKDVAHYGGWINADMVKWMYNGEGRLTKDNYCEYLEKIEEFFGNYDYDSLFE